MMRIPAKVPGVPLGLFPHVIEFCRSISPKSNPIFLVTLATTNDLPLECFDNARRHAEAEGGRVVLGWRIWEHYGLMIEGEVHAVLETPDCQLRDVTPHREPTNQILFLPDDTIFYDGQQINNIRRPLNDDPNVVEFIRICDAEFALLNRGTRAKQNGHLTLVGTEALEYQRLSRQKLLASLAIYKTPPNRNDLCRCGSGRKYKRCCFTKA